MLRSCLTLSSFLFAALTSPLFTQSLHAADAFTARFEHDTEGTWLAYPTRPGWHYKVERSDSTADEGFAYVPGTFSYGDGQQARLWIAPPPPPPGPVTAPPPRTWHSVHLRVHVATEPGVEKIEVIRLGPPDQPPLWGTVLSKKLHPRPWPQFLLINGDTPEVRWRISGTVFSRPSVAVPGDPDSGFTYTESSPLPPGAAEDLALLESHWARIVGQLTPSFDDSVYLPTEEEPEPDTSGTPPPIPAEPQRVFYRVKETAIDTNGNGLYDWWELQHSYEPFVLAGTNGYADPYSDVDGDGLDGLAEQNAGTNPHHWDTDGDLSPDGEELEELTSPLDPQSTPLVLAGLSRRMLSVLWYQQNGWLWGINGYADWDSGTVPGLPASWVPGRKIYSDPIADGQWNTGFPRLEEWAGLLTSAAEFPAVMPVGTRKLQSYTDSILPAYATSPLLSVPVLSGAGRYKPWDDESTSLDHQRVWMRGPAAVSGSISRTLILRKETLRGHHDVTSLLQPVIIDSHEVTCETVTLTIPKGNNRISSDYVDLTPSFQMESAHSPSEKPFQIVRWSLIPFDAAPEALAVNSNFDEGDVHDGSQAAKPDCANDTLKAKRDHLDGKWKRDDIVTDGLHKGFFGLRPGTFSYAETAGAVVKIKKLDRIDPETNRKQSGNLRLYVVWGPKGSESEMKIELYDKDSLVANDIGPLLYNEEPSSTPTFYLEGVDPGMITLEFSYQNGSTSFQHQQEFLVATKNTRDQWRDEVRYHIRLQNSVLNVPFADIANIDPALGFRQPGVTRDNSRLISRMYYYYAQLYAENPDKFLWPGMARVAGSSVYAGMSDMYLWNTLPIIGDAGAVAFMNEFLIPGAQAIFNDLAWAHRAYAASGIHAIKHVDETEANAVDFRAWQRLDEGIAENDMTKIRDAGGDLLDREQNVVIQPYYTAIGPVKFKQPGWNHPIVWIGGVEVPRDSDGRCEIGEWMSANAVNNPIIGPNPIPPGSNYGPLSFRSVVPGGRLDNRDHRWAWIIHHEHGMLPRWCGTGTGEGNFTSIMRLTAVARNLRESALDYSMTGGAGLPAW